MRRQVKGWVWFLQMLMLLPSLPLRPPYPGPLFLTGSWQRWDPRTCQRLSKHKEEAFWSRSHAFEDGVWPEAGLDVEHTACELIVPASSWIWELPVGSRCLMDARASIWGRGASGWHAELFLLVTAALASVLRCVAGIPRWSGSYSPAELLIKHSPALLPTSSAQAPGKRYPASFLTFCYSLRLRFLDAMLIERDLAILPVCKDIFPLLLAS